MRAPTTVVVAGWTVTRRQSGWPGVGVEWIMASAPEDRAWLTPAGVSAVLAHVGAYMTPDKAAAVGEAAPSRSGSDGEAFVVHVSCQCVCLPVLAADAQVQLDGLATLLASPTNVFQGAA